MALLTTTNNSALATTAEGSLLVQQTAQVSTALQVADVEMIGETVYRYPVVTGNPSASWIAEGAEISLSDPNVIEQTVVPSKLAALTKVSRELLEDRKEAAGIVTTGMIADLAQKLDAAFFTKNTTMGPSGIDVTGVTAVSAGSSWSNLDPFETAISNAQAFSANVTAFVANPTTALALSTLREGTGSNRNLLQPDPTQASRKLIGGVPLFVSPAVAAGTVWGIPSDRVRVVINRDVELTVSTDAYFSSDSVAIRGTLRVGFTVGHPAAIQKIKLSA